MKKKLIEKNCKFNECEEIFFTTKTDTRRKYCTKHSLITRNNHHQHYVKKYKDQLQEMSKLKNFNIIYSGHSSLGYGFKYEKKDYFGFSFTKIKKQQYLEFLEKIKKDLNQEIRRLKND